jgi:hypothetical protein
VLVLLVLLISRAASGQSCIELAGAPYCEGRRAHAIVGNTVFFPQGPPGRRVGNFIELREDGKSRLVGGLPPASGGVAPMNARPAGTLMSLGRGRNFGAYTFPSGVPGRRSSRR